MFLDTVNIEEINKYINLGIFKGITSNPTLLLKEGNERLYQLTKILETDTEKLFVQVNGETVEELWKDYEKVKTIRYHENIGVKVALDFQGILFIQELKNKEPERIILGTAIYSTEQGIMGALVGCHYLAPYINRMFNNNINPFEIVSQIRFFIDENKLDTKIMGASFKNTNQVVETLMKGAHTVTIPPAIVKDMIEKKLATDAIKVFNEDGKKLEEK